MFCVFNYFLLGILVECPFTECLVKLKFIIKSNHVILKPEDSFGKTVDLEIETTMWISKMIEAAREEKDWQTEGWLKRTLMEEQMEEEDVSRIILTMSEEDTDWQTKEDTILSYYNGLNRVIEGDRDIIDNNSFLKQR